MRGKIYRQQADGLLWIRTTDEREDIACAMTELPLWLQPMQPQNDMNKSASLIGTFLEFSVTNNRAEHVYVVTGFSSHPGGLRS